jgi:hypothetical protein
METSDFENILNQWRILDEPERWSLKSVFLQEHPKQDFDTQDFVRFLEKRYDVALSSRAT